MDWIRRNWPDLLIGIALLAVIAGIIATLLTGGSFFPLGGSGNAGGAQQQTVDRPFGSGDPGGVGGALGRSGGDDSAGAFGNSSSASGGDDPDGASSGAGEGFSVGPVGGEPAGAGEAGAGVEVTALPLPGSEGNRSEPNQQSAAAAPSAGAGAGGEAAGAGRADSSSTAAAAGAASAGAAPAVDQGEYRISVGAFSSDENAQAQAQRFRNAGYPVFTGTQGNLAIVLVGPYDDLSQAESVAQRIAAGGFGIEPLIYRFQPDDESATGAGPAPSGAAASTPQSTAAASTQAASAAATTPAPTPTAAGAGSARYVQVGAYGNAPSAQPQKQRLEGLGFRVTEREEGDLIKLLVGPFEGESLETARALLAEHGIDHFVR